MRVDVASLTVSCGASSSSVASSPRCRPSRRPSAPAAAPAPGRAACPVADTFYKARLPGGRFLYNRSCHPPPNIATGGHGGDAVPPPSARGMWYYYAAAPTCCCRSGACSSRRRRRRGAAIARAAQAATRRMRRAAHRAEANAQATRSRRGAARAGARQRGAEWLLLRAASPPVPVPTTAAEGALGRSRRRARDVDCGRRLVAGRGGGAAAPPGVRHARAAGSAVDEKYCGQPGFWGTEIWDVRRSAACRASTAAATSSTIGARAPPALRHNLAVAPPLGRGPPRAPRGILRTASRARQRAGLRSRRRARARPRALRRSRRATSASGRWCSAGPRLASQVTHTIV